MNRLSSSVLLTCCLFILAGCASDGIPEWRYFQGNLSGQGYIPVQSGFAVSSAWSSGPYKITSSSPVIGVDVDGKEVIYFGTADGELVAINSDDGNERWRRSFASDTQSAHIVSTPAISRNGDIYVISNHCDADGRIRSILYKVDEFSRIRWSFAIADDGFTSGSPKILKWGEDTLVFLYVTVVADGDPQGALIVLRDSGKTVELLDRRALGHCKWNSAELRVSAADVFNSLSDVWDFISVFRGDTAEGDGALPDMFVDPTIAVYADRKLPLIAIADNLCSIGAYEWDEQLTVVWRQFHPYEKHSSPVVLPNGLLVFGREDGSVLAYDLEAGIKLWTHDAGQPVFATPAATPAANLVLIAKDQIEVLGQRDGNLVYDGAFPRRFALSGQTFASPVVTQNCFYVSTDAMLTFSHDLATRSQDTNFRGNGLASIALGNNGAIYAVAADGTIRKYLGPK